MIILPSSLVEELAIYLDSLGLGKYDKDGISGNIFINFLPSNPEDCIALYVRDSLPGSFKLGYDSPQIQIITRGVQDPPTEAKAQEIYDKLQGLNHLLLGQIWVVSVGSNGSGPSFIGRNENNLVEFSLNFVFEIRNKNIHRE